MKNSLDDSKGKNCLPFHTKSLFRAISCSMREKPQLWKVNTWIVFGQNGANGCGMVLGNWCLGTTISLNMSKPILCEMFQPEMRGK